MGWAALAFFVVVIMITGFVMPTVMIGVISISFDAYKKRVEEERHIETMVAKVQARCQTWCANIVCAAPCTQP